MTQRSTAEWHALFAKQATSGMTVTAFCHKHNLNACYFSTRRKQLQVDKGMKAPSAFVPVTITGQSTAPTLALHHGQSLVLNIPMSVSPVWLAELIERLQA